MRFEWNATDSETGAEIRYVLPRRSVVISELREDLALTREEWEEFKAVVEECFDANEPEGDE